MNTARKTRKRETNTQIVRRMMEHSQFGAMSQMFIMEAISRYAKQCAEVDAAVFDSPLINGAAWVGVAKEIRDTLAEAYR